MLHTVTSSWWCAHTIFWHESYFRRFTTDHCDLQFIDAFCSRNSLWIHDCASQYTGCRECKYSSFPKKRIYNIPMKKFYTRISIVIATFQNESIITIVFRDSRGPRCTPLSDTGSRQWRGHVSCLPSKVSIIYSSTL